MGRTIGPPPSLAAFSCHSRYPQIQHPDTISSNPCHTAPVGFPKMGDRRNHRSMQFYREKALIFGFEKHPQGIILLSYSNMVIILLYIVVILQRSTHENMAHLPAEGMVIGHMIRVNITILRYPILTSNPLIVGCDNCYVPNNIFFKQLVIDGYCKWVHNIGSGMTTAPIFVSHLKRPLRSRQIRNRSRSSSRASSVAASPQQMTRQVMGSRMSSRAQLTQMSLPGVGAIFRYVSCIYNAHTHIYIYIIIL